MSAIAVTDDQFESEVLSAEGPVLVDFWAEWCGPCKSLAPILDEVAGEMAGKLKVVKVNIEEAPEAPTKYRILSIPTLILFKNGEVVDTRGGAMPKDQLTSWLEEKL